MDDVAGFHFTDDPRPFSAPPAAVVRVPQGLRAKRALLGEFAGSLKFPGYFGWNWDALEECLRDLSWLASPKKIVVLHGDVPFSQGGTSRGIYLSILQAAATRWRGGNEHELQAVFPTSTKEDVLRALQCDRS